MFFNIHAAQHTLRKYYAYVNGHGSRLKQCKLAIISLSSTDVYALLTNNKHDLFHEN